jgi:hypothetical protein
MPLSDREAAFGFLKGLEQHLSQRLPAPKTVREWARQKKLAAPPGKDVSYENLFVEEFVLPAIPQYLSQAAQLTSDQIFAAFLTEADSLKREGISSGSPASSKKHLFKKVFGVTPRSVVTLWWDKSEKFPMAQSCPDWAFRAPCPHRTVFEAKLFRQGGIDAAKTELVKATYQCMFYRGQPTIPEVGKHTAWDYQYACLMAYDASENQTLVEAWKTIRPEVRDGCWDSSNIFVMVLPSTRTDP